MTTQSSNPSSQDPQLPNQADGAAGSESSDKLVFEAREQIREDYVQNAVKFLSHPKVRGSPVNYRRSFLEKKGLTKEEIDEAFRQVPDPQPNTTSVGAAGSQQANNPSQSTGVQPYTSVQTLQPSASPVTAGPIALGTAQQKFSWFHTFLASGLFLGCGVSVAVFLKKVFLPRLKSWIRKVVAEGDETEDKKLKSKLEETAEAVKASGSAVAAIAKTTQDLLATKEEEKKMLVNLMQALTSQAKEIKSLSESVQNSREDRFSQYKLLEEHIPSAPRNGPVNSSWRAPQQTNMYGPPNSDFSTGRPSYVPEPTPGSFSKSYVEAMSTGQRGERPSGSKPWEMPQYSQQRPGFGSQSQFSDDGLNSEPQENYGPPYHLNGKAYDKRSTDSPAEDLRPFSYGAGAEERPFQRRWVPPQPPSVVMPEAAAAIRQPRSVTKQQSVDGQWAPRDAVPKASEAVAEMQTGGAPLKASEAIAEMQTNVAPLRASEAFSEMATNGGASEAIAGMQTNSAPPRASEAVAGVQTGGTAKASEVVAEVPAVGNTVIGTDHTETEERSEAVEIN